MNKTDVAPEGMFPSCTRASMLQERLESRSRVGGLLWLKKSLWVGNNEIVFELIVATIAQSRIILFILHVAISLVNILQLPRLRPEAH